jgi:hypothetical protein
MSFIRYALPALAAVGAAQASCSTSATLTVQNAGDASALATCTTFSGSLAVATGTSDSINFPNVKVLTGDLTIANAPNITNLGADSLQSIGGSFDVNNCQILSSLSFPQLTSTGELSLQALPNLNVLGFTSNVKTATTLNIQNTFLQTLDGINLQKVNSIYVANNRLLQDISFQVDIISQSLILESNGDQLTASFPNLLSASNLTFRNCPSVSIPSLANVTGSLGFYENSFASLAAPNLTSVGQTLAINTNTALTNISMPILKTIGGGFQVQNNTLLKVATFPALQTIGGALDFYGTFTSVTLAALKDNRGAFNLQSTEDISASCTTFKAEQGANSVIKGKYVCAGSQSTPGNINSSPTGSGSSTTKKAAAANVIPNTAIGGLLGVVAAVFGLL